MTQTPRPTPLVLACAGMLALPVVLLIACCFLALYSLAGDSHDAASLSGPAWTGVVLLPVPATLLVRLEYRAIFHRDARAAAWVSGLCLWFPILGSIGWIEGMLCLTNVLPREHKWRSWAEFGAYSATLACAAFIGVGHFRWWRLLTAAKAAQVSDRDA